MDADNHNQEFEEIPAEEHCTECNMEGDQSLALQFQHPKFGVQVTNRRYIFKEYEKCFTGRAAVTWLVSTEKLSRAEAVDIGQKFMDDGQFFSVTKKKDMVFHDKNFLYRFAKHDTSRRITPQQVDPNKPFYLGVHGFLGCPFCKRAVNIANALLEEVGPALIILDVLEHENRVAYDKWLREKKIVLSVKSQSARYHTSSPIVWKTDDESYIGGMDEMLKFLIQLPAFSKTKTLRNNQPENPFLTFTKGIPVILRNFKSTLPF